MVCLGSSSGDDALTPAAAERPELGHLARWTVSSHKYGFGVDNLRDGNENTFWQCVVRPCLALPAPAVPPGCSEGYS